MIHSKRLFAKTKIVCTLGPASNSPETITAMVHAGMDVARLNFSHGAHDEHLNTLRLLRRAARKMSEPVSVIQDLQGPKIRIGELKASPVELVPDHLVTITTEDVTGDAARLSTTYKHLPKDVRNGDRVLLDDGKIELKVTTVRGNDVELKVVIGGMLTAHKGINLPGIAVSAPSLTEKDKEDLQFAFKHDIDYVALSFVRRAHDVAALRDFIIENGPKGRKIPIIAKIEKGEAIADIDAILKEADAIMVARGDLGVELPTEDVPLLQKMIVRKCNEQGKPVIIATQMLESMIFNPTPTRAEASDVANAVLDGADAVMLSGETSVGKFPIQTVEVMERIVRKTEDQVMMQEKYDPDWISTIHEYDPLSKSACVLAENLKASTIVTLTHSGSTALHVAKFRPHARIIAVTDREKIMRRLNLVWGIRGLIVEDLKKDTDATFKKIQEQLLEEGYVERGETIVMLAGIPLFEGHPTNTIKVDKV
ncbi:MAG: pyruvate kinase [Ignavibacteriae bacterium]|nr:pyruvate kinase [Ignavibacteria bacterium]MBI3365336.1 pyruvate kinase [Ignavibacteriota bacterium]